MENSRCCQQVHSEGMMFQFHQCLRQGYLEHQGRMYCKLHHPPSIDARKKEQPHCRYKYTASTCNTRVKEGQKYCSFHADLVRHEILYAKAEAYDRIGELLKSSGKFTNSLKLKQLAELDLENE